MPVLRNLDFALLPLALAVFLLAGEPVGGWAAGAALWIAWRIVGALGERRAGTAAHAKELAVVAVVSMLGRAWLLILMLLALGLLAGEDVALGASILVLALFTVHFMTKLLLRPAATRRPTTI